MKITSASESYSYQSLTATGRGASRPAEAQPAPRESSNADTVAISPRGAFQVRLEAETRRYAAGARQSQGIAPERMEALKQKYQGDSCPVSGMDVTRAMLGGICGMQP